MRNFIYAGKADYEAGILRQNSRKLRVLIFPGPLSLRMNAKTTYNI